MAKKLEQWQVEDAVRLKVIFEQSGYSQLQFGVEFDIGNQSMVGQYLNGIRPLNLTVAGKFAKGLNCQIEKFSPQLAKQIKELTGFIASPLSPRQQAILALFGDLTDSKQEEMYRELQEAQQESEVTPIMLDGPEKKKIA